MEAVPSCRRPGSVRFDTNYWKTFIHARLAVAMGDSGCLSLLGSKPDAHRLLAEHLTAEYRIRTEGRGRRVDEWKLHPGRDNHWLDCLAGAAVGAAMIGPAIREVGRGQRGKKREYVSIAQMQRDAQARHAERNREMMRGG